MRENDGYGPVGRLLVCKADLRHPLPRSESFYRYCLSDRACPIIYRFAIPVGARIESHGPLRVFGCYRRSSLELGPYCILVRYVDSISTPFARHPVPDVANKAPKGVAITVERPYLKRGFIEQCQVQVVHITTPVVLFVSYIPALSMQMAS